MATLTEQSIKARNIIADHIAATEKTYGCEDCKHYSNHRCKLWQVVISKPDDSHCESLQRKSA